MTFSRPSAALQLQILLWRHGWAWPIAFALVLLGWAVQVMVLQPNQKAGHALQAEATRLRVQQPAADALRRAQEAPHGMPAVIAAAPAPTEIAARLLVLAEAEGVTLPRGDYQERPHPTLPLLQLRVTQPVRASYPQVRRYLEAVLRELPHASLDQVTAHRNDVAEGQLEVRLHWSFWRPLAPPSTAPADRRGT